MENTILEVYGPFDISCDGQDRGSCKKIDKADAKEFWKQPDVSAISKKQGCYIFALRAAKGFTPWYVGQAGKNFLQECFTSHKMGHYNDVLWKGRKGAPVMFFVAPSGNKNKVSAGILKEMEEYLIQSAVYKNPDLSNIQNRKTPEWGISGVVRGGKGRRAVISNTFKKMMGI